MASENDKSYRESYDWATRQQLLIYAVNINKVRNNDRKVERPGSLDA